MFFLITSALSAQTTGDINSTVRVIISGSHSPLTRLAGEAGRVSASTQFKGMSIVYQRSRAQEAALQKLLEAQQNHSSALYHKWITPDQFAARFGMADADLAKTEAWLEQQGFTVQGVSRSKTRIRFSGSVEQAEAAFSAEIHYYKIRGETKYAPAGDLSIPAALSSVVQNVTNLSSFHPHAHVTFAKPTAHFTSSQSSSHYLTPGDVATIYDVTAAYNAGYTGTGQSIAAVGQSSVELPDIEAFQSAAGLTTKDPTEVLVPDSGTAAEISGDEAESDLDLEYSGAIAKGATIYFVYVGNNTNYSVWDSIEYAVDTQIAPIITNSYGDCETDLSSTDYSTLNSIMEQAAAQGQSIISASGDSGSTDCYEDTSLTTAQRTALAVDFPASSQYVTGIGGTEFPSADVASTNTTYWNSASGSDVVSSALSYIPEQVWNDDDSTDGLSSGGGGTSSLTARPSWQTGVTGIPSGSYRLVPDISLDASPNNAGYLYCSSDSTSTGVTGSCSNGFRDSSNEYLTVAGGTSFGAPIFAGMLAIINQKLNSTGQGVVNSTLYSLAASSTTYATAFHDITSGSNECTAGSTYCSSTGESEYAATTGYDEASGLGSIDLYNLLTAWPATSSASSLVGSATTLTASSTTPASGASDTITITVTSEATVSTTTPAGTLAVTVDGAAQTSSLALTDGSATYTFSSSTTGTHVIGATYSGDSVYAASTGTLTVTVGSSTTSSSGSFALTATGVTVSAGSSGTSTVTVTPSNGYTGNIGWTVSSSTTLSDACYTIADATVSSTAAVTATMTIYTNESSCSSISGSSSSNPSGKAGKRRFTAARASNAGQRRPGGVTASLAGLLIFGLSGLKLRRGGARAAAALSLALFAGMVTWGCGGSGSSSASSETADAAKGTYQLTIVGTDTSSSVTASTTATITIE